MLKKETFNLEDSNCAKLGSAEDKAARVAAAATEKAWAKAGKKPGMQIWRIEKFKVKASKTPIGTFYDDDSYICLNTYLVKDENGKETDKLGWDIHFWLGKTTSQDEYGTAAYKTVELDDFLGGGPVQHREVSGYESSLFLSYFENLGGIRLLEGGCESGFNKVKPTEYKPRLLHLKGKRRIRVTEVPLEAASFNSGDVFLLDKGMDIYLWQGKKSGMNEKARGGQLARALDDERGGKPEVHVFRQTDSDVAEFWTAFGLDSVPEVSDESGDDTEWEKDSKKSLWQLSDASGELTFTKVAEGKVHRDMLKTEDVFIFDIGSEIFAWIGNGASDSEKANGLKFAQEYLKKNNRPAQLPITKLLENANSNVFNSSFDRK